MSPINPFLGGGMQKKLATFIMLICISCLIKPHFWAEIILSSLLKPNMNQGTKDVADTPIVSKWLIETDYSIFCSEESAADIVPN